MEKEYCQAKKVLSLYQVIEYYVTNIFNEYLRNYLLTQLKCGPENHVLVFE